MKDLTRKQRLVEKTLQRFPFLSEIVSDLEILRINHGLPPLETMDQKIYNLIRFYSYPSVLKKQLSSGYILPLIEREKRRRTHIINNRQRRIARQQKPEIEFTKLLEEARCRNRQKKVSLKAGYIYLIVNPCYDGWIKIGCSVDLEARLNTYQTGDPFRLFRIIFKRFVVDRRKFEKDLLESLSNFEVRNEWVKASLSDIKPIIKAIQSKQ